MKINFLLPDCGYKPSGGFKIAYTYANAFSKQGHEVTIVYPAGCKRGIFNIPGWVRTLRDRKLGSEWFEFDKNIKRIYTVGLYEKYIPDADVSIATAYETALFLNRYSEKKGKKIYFIQGLEIWAASKEKVLNTWTFPMFKIVISKYLLNIGKELGIEDIAYIPNAIDLNIFQVYSNWKRREKCVVMMYSNDEIKGSMYGINALIKLKEKLPELNARLFGKCKRPEDLPKWIEYYENPEQEFLVKGIYNRARVFLCSSIYEGWGLPAMEAMACGTAVVTTDCGGIRDFAIPSETALVCSVKDVESMKCAMFELLTNDSLRETLIENALQKVKEYNWDKSTERFLEVINQTINTH